MGCHAESASVRSIRAAACDVGVPAVAQRCTELTFCHVSSCLQLEVAHALRHCRTTRPPMQWAARPACPAVLQRQRDKRAVVPPVWHPPGVTPR